MAATLENNCVVVAAIDFGTTFTGYAFSYVHDYKNIRTSTFGGKLIEDRVPTTVLLKPDKSFHSFGFKAEDDYTNLIDDENDEYMNEDDDEVEDGKEKTITRKVISKDPKDWFYFRHFKMALYTAEKLTKDMEIYDNEGRPMKAMTIVTMVIKYLKELAVDIICQTKEGLVEKHIQWVITIPAIWSDSARQFMREAATEAGIPEDLLRLVLEPEAASVFCSEQPSKVYENKQIESFSVGSKYILADLGGGTVDICVHEIIENGRIRELYQASGDALGGTNVDNEFRQFLMKLVGADVLKKFKTKHAEEYLTLTRDIEKKKKTFDKNTNKLVFSISPILTDLVQSELDQPLENVICHTNYSQEVKFNRNKLYIDKTIVREFFKKSVDGIIEHLREIIKENGGQDIKRLILVGGFSESPYLRDKIVTEMKELTVLLQPDARLAVLMGAVLMGYKPRTIVERRARYTYGFRIVKSFIEGEHPESLKCIRNGEVKCIGIFHKLISQGQILTCGQVFQTSTSDSLTMDESKQLVFVTKLYKSPRQDPQYCTEEEECTCVGEITLNPPLEGWPDKVEFENHLIVGETEFTVKTFNKQTGEEYEAKVDFL